MRMRQSAKIILPFMALTSVAVVLYRLFAKLKDIYEPNDRNHIILFSFQNLKNLTHFAKIPDRSSVVVSSTLMHRWEKSDRYTLKKPTTQYSSCTSALSFFRLLRGEVIHWPPIFSRPQKT